jgi:hypothetical protein
MIADVLISGTLFREPEQCTSESGRAFERATLKAKVWGTATIRNSGDSRLRKRSR